MSVSSILAFVLAGAAAKVKSRRVARLSEERIDGSAKELAKAKARIAELEGDVHRANIQFRRDQELIDVWRARALFAEAPQGAILPAGADFRPPQIAHAHAQMMQANMLQAQGMQQQAQSQLHAYTNQGLAQHQQAMQSYAHGMGLLGAQSLIDAELFCNCVPSRSQVWATSDPE
jgi:hypothetical protein